MIVSLWINQQPGQPNPTINHTRHITHSPKKSYPPGNLSSLGNTSRRERDGPHTSLTAW